jgi:hypothetical protein
MENASRIPQRFELAPFIRKERIRLSILHNPSIPKHRNPVKVSNSLQSVRHSNDSAVLEMIGDDLLHELVSL